MKRDYSSLEDFVFRLIQRNSSLTTEEVYSFFNNVHPRITLEKVLDALDSLATSNRIKLVARGLKDNWLDRYSSN